MLQLIKNDYKPLYLQDLKAKSGLGIPEIREIVYDLIKQGDVVWTRQGYKAA